MEVGLGVLGWTPAAFWAATPHELWAAFDGWRKANGLGRDDALVRREEFERLKRRFPDR